MVGRGRRRWLDHAMRQYMVRHGRDRARGGDGDRWPRATTISIAADEHPSIHDFRRGRRGENSIGRHASTAATATADGPCTVPLLSLLVVVAACDRCDAMAHPSSSPTLTRCGTNVQTNASARAKF